MLFLKTFRGNLALRKGRLPLSGFGFEVVLRSMVRASGEGDENEYRFMSSTAGAEAEAEAEAGSAN